MASAAAPRAAAVAQKSAAVPPKAPVAAAAPPVTTSEPEDPFGALYELADHEESGSPVQESPRCPQCRSTMADGAVLCVKCGYDTRTGKKLSTESVSKAGKAKPFVPGKKQKPVDMMAAQGSFLLGVALCAAFGLGVAAIWFGIAKATGYGLPLIGCLTGAACGAGMHIGQKGTSDIGGITAAVITFLSIMAAKLAVAYMVLLPLAQTLDDESTFKLVLMYSMVRPSSLISLVVGTGVAWRTASGSMSG
jgi:hypothetical protein